MHGVAVYAKDTVHGMGPRPDSILAMPGLVTGPTTSFLCSPGRGPVCLSLGTRCADTGPSPGCRVGRGAKRHWALGLECAAR